MHVIEGKGRTFWAATDGSSTYYMGQLVSCIAASKANCNGAVVPLAVAAGAFDLTNYQVPLGVVSAFNVRNPVYDPTTTLQYITGSQVTQALQLATEKTGAEGMYIKGDPQMLVEITEITPQSVIKAPIYNATYGVASTVLTATTAMTDGAVTAITTNAADMSAGVLNMTTIYCRTGVNAGMYRVGKATSNTGPSVTTAFPYNGAIGDTFIWVPMKQGWSTVQIQGPGLFLDSSLAPVVIGTARFGIFIYRLNLAVAGQEYAEFRFEGDHFCAARA
jgi:mRNA-degrading endonuclease toxin of MazEF toxin-antitoxin module